MFGLKECTVLYEVRDEKSEAAGRIKMRVDNRPVPTREDPEAEPGDCIHLDLGVPIWHPISTLITDTAVQCF